jgi:hypothetical protein
MQRPGSLSRRLKSLLSALVPGGSNTICALAATLIEGVAMQDLQRFTGGRSP